VEGRGRNLEGQAADQEDEAKQHTGSGALVDGRSNVFEPGRTGEAIDQGGAIEQHARRQGAQDKVLQACFRGLQIVPVHGRQHIERQGLQFDADIEGDQIAGADHHAHAQGGQQDQDGEFEGRSALAGEPVAAERNGCRTGEIDGDAGIACSGVCLQTARKRDPRGPRADMMAAEIRAQNATNPIESVAFGLKAPTTRRTRAETARSSSGKARTRSISIGPP